MREEKGRRRRRRRGRSVGVKNGFKVFPKMDSGHVWRCWDAPCMVNSKTRRGDEEGTERRGDESKERKLEELGMQGDY